MQVDYVVHMGDDLSVVNAARVSFDKVSSEFIDKDEKLIKYLADHKHWSPFAHPQLCIRVKAPMFVARQLAKHQVGLVWNEVSRRYVDTDPEFFLPTQAYGWRERAENVKQGSSDRKAYITQAIHDEVAGTFQKAFRLYKSLLDSNVCPEQARMILPQATYTEWVWTGSLLAFSRVCNLRLDSHTQKETRNIAQMISSRVEPLFPISWKYLVGRVSTYIY